MKKLSLILLAFLALSAFAIDGEDYLPLGMHYFWNYADSISDETTGTSEHTIINQDVLDGFPIFYLERSSSDGTIDTAMYQIRDDGYYLIDSPLASMGFDVELLIKVFPLSFEIGDIWVAAEIETTIVAMGMEFPVTIVLSTEAVAYEDITVLAGAFDNTIHFEMTAVYDAGVTSGEFVSSAQWYAMDVGPVKTYYNRYNPLDVASSTEEWSELTGYSCENISEKITAPRNSSLTTYPNPFNSTCMIELENEGIIIITSLSGQIVYSSNETNTNHSWHPDDHISSGIYIVSNPQNASSEHILFIK